MVLVPLVALAASALEVLGVEPVGVALVAGVEVEVEEEVLSLLVSVRVGVVVAEGALAFLLLPVDLVPPVAVGSAEAGEGAYSVLVEALVALAGVVGVAVEYLVVVADLVQVEVVVGLDRVVEAGSVQLEAFAPAEAVGDLGRVVSAQAEVVGDLVLVAGQPLVPDSGAEVDLVVEFLPQQVASGVEGVPSFQLHRTE